MNKEKDLENLRSSLAVVSQTNFEKQLRNIRIKHDNEVEKLNQEIKRLSHILQVKEELLSKKTILPEFIEDNSQELNELKMKIHSDQILIDELRGQLQLRSGLSEKDIIRELENQLNNTKEDLDRIKQLFDLKIVQLHDITEKYERLESKLTEARTLEVKVVELQKILNV